MTKFQNYSLLIRHVLVFVCWTSCYMIARVGFNIAKQISLKGTEKIVISRFFWKLWKLCFVYHQQYLAYFMLHKIAVQIRLIKQLMSLVTIKLDD